MRVLDKDGIVVELDHLGMADPERRRFVEAFSRAHGAVLVTGPTGSGKTTTLYGALTRSTRPRRTSSRSRTRSSTGSPASSRCRSTRRRA